MSLIIGHRGAKARYAENTLNAFEKAIEQGADGIELDIHYSKDGELMVFHDFTLSRMCGVNGNIYDFTRNELNQIKVHFKGQIEAIPTLDEVLFLITALQNKFERTLLVNIELKAGGDFYPGIEEKAIQVTNKYLSPSQVIFSSFDHYAVQRIKFLSPESKTGVLTASLMVNPWEYIKKINADYYHPAHDALNAKNLLEYESYQLLVNTYTVNDVRKAKFLLSHGVHAIITDTPDVMVKLKNEMHL